MNGVWVQRIVAAALVVAAIAYVAWRAWRAAVAVARKDKTTGCGPECGC